jgi:EmrB/QacA subfamily drug resistance transporter
VGVLRAPSAGHSSAPGNVWVLVTAILGSAMAFIDGSVVNVALPVMQGALGASAAEMQWIMNGYLLMLSALLLAGGAAGDRFGRRRVFMIGIAVFATASIACGAAPDATLLAVARAAQGIGGALMVPASLALIAASFRDERRSRAIGTWSGASALTTGLGPALGGWLVTALSWRAIFFVNVPFAAVALWLAWRHVPESRDQGAGRLDWSGAGLVTLGLGALTWAAIASADAGVGGAAVIGATALGLVILLTFLWHEMQVRQPLLQLAMFRSRAFSGANALTFLLYAGLSGVLFLLPFILIQVRGETPAQAGLAFLPFTLVMGLLSRWAAALVEYTGARLPLVAGPAVAALGFTWLGLRAGAAGPFWATVLPGMLVLGVGMTLAVAPLTTVVMDSVQPAQVGAASGANNAVARLAGLLAVAVLGAVVLAIQATGMAHRFESVTTLDVPPMKLGFGTAELPSGASAEARQMAAAIARSAFVDGFRAVGVVCAALALAGAMCSLLALRRPPRT